MTMEWKRWMMVDKTHLSRRLRFVGAVALTLTLVVGALRLAGKPAHASGRDEIANDISFNGGRVSSDFISLTNYERTLFGEFIWYWSRTDMIAPPSARLHSNDDIGVHTGAIFRCLVTTTGSIISAPGSYFYGLPQPGFFEHVRRLSIPTTHLALRNEARRQNTYFPQTNNLTYGLELSGTTGYLWRWETGTATPAFDRSRCFDSIQWNPRDERAIFFEPTVWLKGVFRGKLGIGSAGNIRLMDDVRAEDATLETRWLIPDSSSNYLALVSEIMEPSTAYLPQTGILIANTWENGRDNGIYQNTTNFARRDIVITAQVMALNSSFTFEQQHDAWESIAPTTNPDERGTVYLHGNVVQHRKGYVHRANNGGTGYDRMYVFDNRYVRHTPPFALTIR